MFSTETRRDSGFTLIELLIVIVILGVLAAVVVARVSGITDTGKAVSCKQEVREINNAIELYRAKTGSFPPALTMLVPDFLKTLPAATTASGAGTYNSSTGVYTQSASITVC